MNLENIRAFIKEIPLNKMNGQEKFVAVAFFCASGKAGQEVSVTQICSNWKKSILKLDYHPNFYLRAQDNGWVNPIVSKRGSFVITDKGLNLITNYFSKEAYSSGELKKIGALIIVNRKGAHSFDKFLRTLFSSAKKEVLIADSYVDETIFDTTLDQIPKDVIVKLIYNAASDNTKFERRSKRFKVQYSKYECKQYKHLHDRFIIIDNTGYISGPSIKDAAFNSPALVVMLTTKESPSLETFFRELWKSAK